MTPLREKKLGILVAAAPDQPNFRHALRLAECAVARDAEVYLYFIDQALGGLDRPELNNLKKTNARLFACSLGPDDAPNPRFTRTGLGTVSDLIASTDRFVSFT